MPDPLQEALLQRELHEDHNIRKALELLLEPDRPTVPVRLYSDPKKLFREVFSKFGGQELSSDAIGAVPFDKSAIYINKNSQEYQHQLPYHLASKLLHEQVHAKAPNWDRREHPAYERELQFIDQNRLRFDEKYRSQIVKLITDLKKKEKSNEELAWLLGKKK